MQQLLCEAAKNTVVIINGSNCREREDLQVNLDHKDPLDNLDQQDNVVNVVSKDLLDHKARLDLKDRLGKEVSQETKDHRYKKLLLSLKRYGSMFHLQRIKQLCDHLLHYF